MVLYRGVLVDFEVRFDGFRGLINNFWKVFIVFTSVKYMLVVFFGRGNEDFKKVEFYRFEVEF